jgi:hypothetical protein
MFYKQDLIWRSSLQGRIDLEFRHAQKRFLRLMERGLCQAAHTSYNLYGLRIRYTHKLGTTAFDRNNLVSKLCGADPGSVNTNPVALLPDHARLLRDMLDMYQGEHVRLACLELFKNCGNWRNIPNMGILKRELLHLKSSARDAAGPIRESVR